MQAVVLVCFEDGDKSLEWKIHHVPEPFLHISRKLETMTVYRVLRKRLDCSEVKIPVTLSRSLRCTCMPLLMDTHALSLCRD
jgi:hypothetical protein